MTVAMAMPRKSSEGVGQCTSRCQFCGQFKAEPSIKRVKHVPQKTAHSPHAYYVKEVNYVIVFIFVCVEPEEVQTFELGSCINKPM